MISPITNLTALRLSEQLRQMRSEFDRKLGEAQAVNRRKKQITVEIESLSTETELMANVSGVLQQLSRSVQERFLGSIANLVSDGLSSVFKTQIKLLITPEVRNRQVTLDFNLENDDGTITPVTDARGGGLVTLCGVIFQMIMVRLMRDSVRQVIILDEPFAHLSDEYQPAAGELLRSMSQDLDIQVILVSHQSEVNEYADVIYQLSRQGSEVVVAKVK